MRILLLFLGLLLIGVEATSQQCTSGQFEGPVIYDTYHEYYNKPALWNVYNVHDPTVFKQGEWYYMYNTDVGMGYDSGTGALKRRSQDLVHWEFLGQAFDGIPESARDFFLKYNPAYTDNGIWAPFLIKYNDEFRLYYSAPGGLVGENLGFIGWATSASANGPWVDQGKIAGSTPDDTINAIDPTVVFDKTTGQHWMAYGSYQNGIYIVELNSANGGLKTPGDRGTRIAGRAGGRHRAIEGAELNYHDGWYYLFVSYDWLEDYYNVRVGRSENPSGPYYDIHGVDMADYSNNDPLILKPYRFNHHEGWMGTGHCSVYNDSGQYYMFHQARPRTDKYNMVLHARKIFWIDGWPVVSPERYAAAPQCEISADSLVGEWEQIDLEPEYGVLFSNSETIDLKSNGSINGDTGNTWMLQDSLLTISWNEGQFIIKALVYWGWDWENSCLTMLFAGMNNEGICVWGKKIVDKAIARHTELISGAAYSIRSHYSNMLIEVPDGSDDDGVSIRQGKDNGKAYQIWRIFQYPDGDWAFAAEHSADSKVIEVPDGNPDATFLKLGSFTGEDNQKFSIEYRNDGYFKILTRVSNNEKCFDLYNFSIDEDGFISQWTDLNGVNQAWRFTHIDSLGIDNSLDLQLSHDSYFNIYPNPFTHDIHLELSAQTILHRADMVNMLGQVVFTSEKKIVGNQTSLEIPENLRGKIFVLRLYTNRGLLTKKIVKR